MISQFMSHAQEDRHSKRTKVICVPMTAQDITEMRSLSTMQARPVVSCIPDDEQRVGRVCSRPQSCKRSSWVCQRWSAGKIWSPWQWRTRANETEEMMMQSQKSVEPHRSQGARMFFLGTPTLWTGDTGHLHLISYASKWSAFQAETYSLQPEIEEGDRIRAAVADVMESWSAKTGSLPPPHSLDKSGSQTVGQPKRRYWIPKPLHMVTKDSVSKSHRWDKAYGEVRWLDRRSIRAGWTTRRTGRQGTMDWHGRHDCRSVGKADGKWKTDLHIENQPLGHSTAPSFNLDQTSKTIETPKDRTYRDRQPAGSISSWELHWWNKPDRSWLGLSWVARFITPACRFCTAQFASMPEEPRVWDSAVT